LTGSPVFSRTIATRIPSDPDGLAKLDVTSGAAVDGKTTDPIELMPLAE
jgi:hypothetical protein